MVAICGRWWGFTMPRLNPSWRASRDLRMSVTMSLMSSTGAFPPCLSLFKPPQDLLGGVRLGDELPDERKLRVRKLGGVQKEAVVEGDVADVRKVRPELVGGLGRGVGEEVGEHLE